MQGSLVFNVSAEIIRVDLPQKSCVLVSRSGGLALMDAPVEGDTPLLEITWDKRACSWVIKPSGDHCVCTRNGTKLPAIKSRLNQNDTVQLGDYGKITFHRSLEAPQWNDQPTEFVDLKGSSLMIFGRLKIRVKLELI